MVSKEVEISFKNRLDKACEIIESSNIEYITIGTFGSYARGTYKSNSDIDIVMVVNELPNRRDRAILRDDLDEINCDITYMLKASFENPWNEFTRVVVRDFKEM